MAYATKQNMIDAYTEEALIELTDRADPATGAIDDTVLDLALADAAALIDSYISRRYSPALAAAAPVLRSKAQAIAYYILHRGNYPEQIRTAFEDALEFLKAVSMGHANLDIAGVQPPSAPADARVEGPARLFSRDSMKGL